MTREVRQVSRKTFGSGDFTPALPLATFLLKENIVGENVQLLTQTVLNGADGTNLNPLFMSAVKEYMKTGKSFTDFCNPDYVMFADEAEEEYYLITNIFSEEVLRVGERFQISKATFIDWVNVLNKSLNKPLTVEDAYYIAAVAPLLSVPAYNMFLKDTDKLDEHNRIRFDAIKKYVTLQANLRLEQGIQFQGKQVFTLCETYCVEDLVALIHAGHDLNNIITLNKLGMVSVEDIITNGSNIPQEWLNIVQ